MNIYVFDRLAHRAQSGYGALARHLILGLQERGHDVTLPGGFHKPWQEVEVGARERLEGLRHEQAVPSDIDVVLQVGIPGNCRSFDVPSVMYTQNGLGGLRLDWIDPLQNADHVVVPSAFDREVFARYVDGVSVSPQGSNPSVFRPFPKWRAEGSERFTFFFVGSYGFRKGVDVLLAAFLREFKASEPVELWLKCANIGVGGHVNHLLGMIQTYCPLANVRVFPSSISPAWMCRYYNRVDCVVTVSRGEGWCMPITEGLLCGKPVIAPDSSAPGEYLSDDAAHLVPGVEREVAEISDPFGGALVNSYGDSGITYFEPDQGALRETMRAVVSEPEEATRRAETGQAMVRERYDWRSAVDGVEEALARAVAP